MSDASAPRIVIDKSTPITIGAVLAFLSGAFALGVWMNGKFVAIEVGVTKIESRLARLEDRYSDRWSATDMRLWEASLVRDNPTIRAPGAGVIIRERPEEKGQK